MKTCFCFILSILLPAIALAQESAMVVKHGEVFREAGRFAGWPANNGVWIWGDEILVGFTLGYMSTDFDGHPIDGERKSEAVFGRSLDGGASWSVEPYAFAEGHGETVDCPGGLDFSLADSAVQFKGDTFRYSADRGKTWQGPYQLPHFDRPGLLARTDYIVKGPHDLMAFMAAEKDDGEEGWPIAIRTTDGGKTWDLLGYIGGMPGEGEYAIMPSTLELTNGALLSIIRKRGIIDGEKQWWIDGYLSPDAGKHWYLLDAPTIDNAGNPPHMIRLADGRIALTYGFRTPPYGVRVRISSDEGRTWGPEHILDDRGGSWDIGYPRTVQRADGKCVTMYYFNEAEKGERFIAYTIWDPAVE